jgi:hypothetical protein
LLGRVSGRPRLSGIAHQGTFCQLPQPLGDLAILLCELVVASRMFQVFVVTLAAFG